MKKSDYFVQTPTQTRVLARDRKREELMILGNTNQEQIDFLLSISFDLTPLGFECFVAYFLSTHYGYKTNVQGGFYDGCVDIKGIRKKLDGTKEYMIAQCKQWNTYSIGLSEVASFYGQVVDTRYEYPTTELYYASVGKYTGQARAFMDEKSITYLDFDTFLNAGEYICHEDFLKYLSTHAQEITQSTKDKDQLRIYIDTNRDVYELLKQVRSTLSRTYAVPAFAIAHNQQLVEICKRQPKSLNELVGVGGLGIHQVEKYGPEFIKALAKISK